MSLRDAVTVTFKPEPEVPAGAPCYAPSPTVEEFIYAVAGGPVTEFRLLMLTSSRGEGKSSGAIFALLALAERVRRDGKGSLLPLRVAVVRDTWVNLSRTTIATFEKQHRMGLGLTWRDGQREAIVPGQLHFFFFGMDNRADVDKLQGFEAAVLWLEEVAPGAELTQGIPAETLGIGRTSLRQEGVPKRILMTFNPPDEDHWPLWHGTPVLTPTGWIKIGDLRPGDAVIAADGTTTEVTGVYPRGAQSLYRVMFSDGASVLATDDHPWAIESKRDRSGKATCRCRSKARCRRRPAILVATTAQIRRRLETKAGQRHYRWSIPLVGPAQFPEQPMPVDPYVLGALLGDGTLTMPNGQVAFCSADAEVVAAVRAGLPPGHYLRHLRNYDYVILSGGGRHTPNLVNRAIRALGLSGHAAATKFIPDVYLWNSPGIRLAVLQGLLDTDGHASPDSNSVSFASIYERLIECVEFLVRSLGGVTRRRAKGRIGPRRPHELYVLGITLPDGVMPFRLSRKNARLSPKSKRHQPRRYIVGCDPCGEGEAVCISVAHPRRLFVCDQFVVTHNSLKVEEHLANLNMANLVVHRFWIPPGERSAHFRSMALRAARSGSFALARQWEEAAEEFDTYREQNIAFLESIGRHDLVARLGKGEIGGVQIGEAVMSTFSHKLHVTEPGEKLIALPGSQMWRAHDAGLTPSCCPGAARVAMADGSTKRIDEIRVGDTVLTVTGDPPSLLTVGNVIACGLTGWKPCVEVRTKHRWLRVSHDHPVLVASPESSGWTRHGDKRTRWYTSRWKLANEVCPGDWLISVSRLPSLRPVPPPDSPWPISPALLELIGVWLGDGCYTGGKHRRGISLAAYDDGIAERWKQLIIDATGLVPAIYEHRGKGPQVVLNRTAAGACLYALGCEGYSSTKRIPRWVFSLSAELRLACLRGLLDSDGTVLKQGTVRFSLRSVDLVWDIWALCQSLGMQTPTVRVHTRATGYWRGNRYPKEFAGFTSTDTMWSLVGSSKWAHRLKQHRIVRHRFRVTGDLEAERVMRIDRSTVAEPVWNCQVDGGGTIVVHGVVTHNTVWIEETPSGNLNVHGSRTSINKSITQHVLDEVIPFQEKSGLRPKRADAGYDGRKGWDYRDCGDPSFFEGDSVQDAEYSAGMALQQILHTTLEVPPTNDWPPRRDAGLVAFQRKGQGPRMLIRIQREENATLIQGLNGRFHYEVNMASGRIDPSIKTAKRVSGIWAQPTDALLYFLVLKFPAHDWLRREPGPGSPKPALPEPKDWLGI